MNPNIPGIPAEVWNKQAKEIQSGFLRVGPEQSIGAGGNLPMGRIPDRSREVSWKHPFTVIPAWDTEMELTKEEQDLTGRPKGAWRLYMTEGFVNGHAPAMQMPTKSIPEGAKVWGNRYGKETRSHARLADFTQVLLTDEFQPYMKATNFMDARGQIVGATPAIPIEVPVFFRPLRAMPRPKPDFLDQFFSMAGAGGFGYGDVPTAGEALALGILGGGAGPTFTTSGIGGDGFPEGDRYLYFCDVVMEIDRPRTRQIFQYDEFAILRFAGFQIDPPDSGLYNARIKNVAVYLIPKPPTIEDIYFGGYIEPTIDEIVMARVFFLSPSKHVLDDGPITPNGSWMPFVRHEVYWNLSYAALNIYDPFKPNRDLDFFKQIGAVLAGGAAYLFLSATADMIEAQHDTISTYLNNTRVRTRFWTS